MEFLHLYAHTFNYDSLGISVRDGGKYFSKRSLTLNPHINKRWTDVQNLVVEHCLEPMKDAAKGTYNIQAIRFAFAYAYKKLGKLNETRRICNISYKMIGFNKVTLLFSLLNKLQNE